MLIIKADDTFARIEQGGIIPSGTVGAQKAKFIFSEHWDKFVKTVQFTGSGVTIEIVPIENGEEVSIPFECLAQPGQLKIALYGVNSTERMPVIYTMVEVRDSGIGDGQLPSAPTPTVYEQILGHIDQLNLKLNTFMQEYKVDDQEKEQIADYANEKLTGQQVLSKIKTSNSGPTQSSLSIFGNVLDSLILPNKETIYEMEDPEYSIPSGLAVKNYVNDITSAMNVSIGQLFDMLETIEIGLEHIVEEQESILGGEA